MNIESEYIYNSDDKIVIKATRSVESGNYFVVCEDVDRDFGRFVLEKLYKFKRVGLSSYWWAYVPDSELKYLRMTLEVYKTEWRLS